MFYTSDAVIDFLFTQKMMKGDGYTVQRFLESIGRREDVLDNRLSSIKQPTLIVWGKEDGLFSLANAERFKKEISGAELVIIDQCGHIPQIEKAAEFNAALLKFLDGDTGSVK